MLVAIAEENKSEYTCSIVSHNNVLYFGKTKYEKLLILDCKVIETTQIRLAIY